MVKYAYNCRNHGRKQFYCGCYLFITVGWGRHIAGRNVWYNSRANGEYCRLAGFGYQWYRDEFGCQHLEYWRKCKYGSGCTLSMVNVTGSVGGSIVLNGGTFTDNSGSPITTITSGGQFINDGGISNSAAADWFCGRSNYHHGTDGASVPTATWASTSTCNIDYSGSLSLAPGDLFQAFGNFTWNCPNQSNSLAADMDYYANTTITGSVNIISTGSGSLSLASFIIGYHGYH